jgi:uncharacterized protein
VPVVPSIAFDWHGETLVAHANRTLEYPALKTLFVADLHLGKGTSFRQLGVPIPCGTTESTLDDLSQALKSADIEHLVFLGDLWHARSSRSPECLQAFEAWSQRHRELRVTLVIGNHDRRAGSFAGPFVAEVDENFAVGPFSCVHHPPVEAENPSLAGHLHPGVSFAGQRMRCFWILPQTIVLPAFGAFTGTARFERQPNDRILAIAEEQHIWEMRL